MEVLYVCALNVILYIFLYQTSKDRLDEQSKWILDRRSEILKLQHRIDVLEQASNSKVLRIEDYKRKF